MHQMHYVLPCLAASVRNVSCWAKLDQEQRSRIQENIRIAVNRFGRDVKQLLTPSE